MLILKDESIRSNGGVIWVGLKKSFTMIMSLLGVSKPENGSVCCGAEPASPCAIMGRLVPIPVEDGIDNGGGISVSDALWLGGVSWDHPRGVELDRNCSQASWTVFATGVVKDWASVSRFRKAVGMTFFAPGVGGQTGFARMNDSMQMAASHWYWKAGAQPRSRSVSDRAWLRIFVTMTA
jgi:hypothetical protein